jgi:mono/diheme cytochrome c family protein
MRTISFKHIAVAAGMLTAFSASPALAQMYTEAQATAGAAQYASECARCHGAQLQGAEGPALTGGQFDGVWRDGPVKALFDFIKEYMPADKPKTLKDPDVAGLTAFILKQNKIPAGDQALTATTAGNIPK